MRIVWYYIEHLLGCYMDDLIFENKYEVEIYFSMLKEIGSGREGICYKKGRIAYKRYNQLYSCLYSDDIAVNRLLYFRDLIINNIYFIRGLIYCNDMVIGSMCDYASGVSCGKLQLHRSKIDKLVNALKELKRNVYELSELMIYLDYNFLGNFLYDGNKFKLIDLGGCFFSEEIPDDILDDDEIKNKDDVLFIYRRNMRMIMKKLFVNITDKYYNNDNFIYAFLWDIDSPYKYYLEDSDLMINPDDTIMGIRDTICEYIGYEIDSFSKCRKDLLRIRKK